MRNNADDDGDLMRLTLINIDPATSQYGTRADYRHRQDSHTETP
jgi:hypothetical protein